MKTTNPAEIALKRMIKKREEKLLDDFDEALLEPIYLKPLIDKIPSSKQIIFARLLLMLEIIGTAPFTLRHDNYRHLTYCKRIIEQTREFQSKSQDFKEIIIPIEKVLDGTIKELDFFETIKKWKYTRNVSKKRVTDRIIAIGKSVLPLLIHTFMNIGKFNGDDGYYISKNIQCELCYIMVHFRNHLVLYALMSYVGDLPSFNSRAMNIALKVLRKLLDSREQLQQAYFIATDRNLVDDEMSRDKRLKEELREMEKTDEELDAEKIKSAETTTKNPNPFVKALKKCFINHLNQGVSKEELSKLYNGWTKFEIVPGKPIYDIWLDACISKRDYLEPMEFIKYCREYLLSNLDKGREGVFIIDWLGFVLTK